MKVELTILPDDTDVLANVCIHGTDRHYPCYQCLAIMAYMYAPKPN